jgi:hypothetical protein
MHAPTWTTRLLGVTAILLALAAPDPVVAAEAAAAALPRDSAAYRDTRCLLPARFAERETTRYVVLSDADADWTRQQAELLERAHHQFHRYCRRLGLSPRPLRHKLVAVVFADRAEYRRFAREHDDVGDPSLSGYYSPRFDRVVFYDIESSPSVAEARQQLAAMESEINELAHRLGRGRAPPEADAEDALRRVQNQYRQHLHQQRQRVDEYAAQTSIATTIHEAIHQLMFHTAVQSPRVHYPLWISEGLATAFETDEPQSAFGPGHEFAARRDDFRSIVDENRLLPLRELVTITRLSADRPERSSVLYHQSYALVDWLSRHRAEALRQYLRAMRAREGERLSAEEHLAAFESAFGDPGALEQAWLRDVRGSTIIAVGGR